MGRSFAWRSLVVFLVVGAVSHLIVRDVIDDHFRDGLEFHAEFVTNTIVAPLYADQSAPADGTGAIDRLRDLIRQDVQILAIELLDRDGNVVAGAGGGLGAPGSTDHELTVTALPMSQGPEEIAMVRVWQDATPSLRAAGRLVSIFDAILLVGLLLLWAVLLPMATQLGRRLESRTQELERQQGELRRLLAGEQQTVVRMREVSELKDRFLSAISHELRTPLTVVLGALMTLRRHQEALPAERRTDLLARAERSAVKLEELITELLELNGDSRGPDPVRREPLDVRNLVRESMAHLPPRAVDLDLEVEEIVGDPVQLERVMANLIGNAFRHAPGDEPVTIRTLSRGDEVEIVVADRGPGVPDELKQAVFEPFRQGDITDAHSPGTGIGLSLVARVVGDHCGRVWVTDRPGGGASFHVRLPRRAASPMSGDVAAPADAEWTGVPVGSH